MKWLSSRFIGLLSVVGLISFSSAAQANDSRWEPTGLTGSAGYVSALAIDPASPATIYAGTATGIYRSTDGGLGWTAANDGLLARDLNVQRLVATGSSLYAVTSSGVYRSTDRAASWRVVRPFFSDQGVFGFAASSSTLYLSTAWCVLVRFDCTWHHGSLSRSLDGGRTWASAGIPEDLVSAIAVDPVSPSTVFAGVQRSANPGVYKSTDFGASFNRSSSGLIGSYVFGLSVSKVLPSTVYARTEVGVFRSTNGGSDWAAANQGLPPGSLALAIDPTSSGTVYAGTDSSGVFKTTDGGEHWSALSTESLTDLQIDSVVVDPSSPSTIYAGTFRDGVFKMTQSEPSPCSSSPTSLCLNRNRFRVEVTWTAAPFGTGAGQSVPLTGDTGAFWFFTPSNLELVVKVLDGRPNNGHIWVFYGALSDVAYTITVTDTETGVAKTYRNSAGHMASAADTEAF